MNNADRPYFYMGKGRGLTRLSTGEVFFVDTDGQDVGVWILLGGIWETFVNDILCALVRPGDVCFDVGANLGYYTIKLASGCGPTGHVYSFEPNPKMARFVQDNININGFADRATLFQAAAGAEKGASTLTFAERAPGGGVVNVPADWIQPGQDRIDIEVVRIDDVVPADLSVNLIKIDTEGFEPLVIAGMQGVLARSPDAAMVVEVAYLQWMQHGDPAELVKSLAGGRRIFRIHHDGDIVEVDIDRIGDALNRDFVSYMLFLPDTEERWAQVRRFERSYRQAQAQAGIAPETTPAPVAAPTRSPRLGARIKRKLLAMLNA